MKGQNENCANCRFQRYDEHADEMTCHRRAPRITALSGRFLVGSTNVFRDPRNGAIDPFEIAEPTHADRYIYACSDSVDRNAKWPSVDGLTWCGEWESQA